MYFHLEDNIEYIHTPFQINGRSNILIFHVPKYAVQTKYKSLECVFFILELPEEPTFILSYEIVENKGPLADRPFMCYGRVGYPRGHLEIWSDFSGNFTTLLSPTNANNDLAYFVSGATVQNGSQCDEFEYVEFHLKLPALTRDNHNSRLRCVVVPGIDFPGVDEVYTEETMKVVESKFVSRRYKRLILLFIKVMSQFL